MLLPKPPSRTRHPVGPNRDPPSRPIPQTSRPSPPRTLTFLSKRSRHAPRLIDNYDESNPLAPTSDLRVSVETKPPRPPPIENYDGSNPLTPVGHRPQTSPFLSKRSHHGTPHRELRRFEPTRLRPPPPPGPRVSAGAKPPRHPSSRTATIRTHSPPPSAGRPASRAGQSNQSHLRALYPHSALAPSGDTSAAPLCLREPRCPPTPVSPPRPRPRDNRFVPRVQFLIEAFRFSYQALQANRVRTLLTALGLLIGNASVILVVTISITSRDLILDKIRGIGSNLVSAYYDAGTQDAAKADADYVKLADVEAIRKQLGPRIVAASAVINSTDRLVIEGRERDVRVIGTDEYYAQVRNLQLLDGRFFDPSDVALRQKVAMLDDKLAAVLFGGAANSVGQVVKIHGLQFTIVGVFKEKTSTFGQSELGDNGASLIPFTVQRYFEAVERVDPMYLQVTAAGDVPAVTQAVAEILASRHRPGARYTVQNLTAILETASTIASVLTLVLMLVSAIALLISGIGIMNIMLVTVTERTREIGVRMSLGASRRAVLLQFLLEAVLISVGGGILGILAGVSVPIAVNLAQDELRIPISILSITVAFGVSFIVGVVFGLLPANRAARLNPTEALRYE